MDFVREFLRDKSPARLLMIVAILLLFVSQFTLAADIAGGNRPSFAAAAPPVQGRAMFDAVLRIAQERHGTVAAGVFGADMQVHLVNDGPVTIPITVR